MDPSVASWKHYFSVQPPIVIWLVAQTMTGTVLQDFLVYQSCVETLGTNYTQCSVLHKNSSSHEALVIKSKVQPEVNDIQIAQSIINSIVPSIIALFLGPWSDIYGRKPVLILTYLGNFLGFVVLSILSSLHVRPWLVLLWAIPGSLCGGFPIIVLSTICYICDITQERNRAWHLALLHALLSLGILLGISAGPLIYDNFGYTAVFSVAAACLGIANLHVLFIIPESIEFHHTRTWSSVFDISLVKGLISTCVKKHIGFNRCVVWCCIVILALNMAILEGEGAIGYLFASARFGWDISAYSIYQGTSLILQILGTPAGIKLIKPCLGHSETIVSMLFVAISIISVLTRAFAWKSWHMYLSQVIGTFNGCLGPIIQTFLSKSIRVEDAGKMFSLTTIAETLIAVGAVPLFGMIYSYTMPPMYPSPVWFVPAGCYTLMIILLIVVHLQHTRYISVQCTPLDEECTESD